MDAEHLFADGGKSVADLDDGGLNAAWWHGELKQYVVEPLDGIVPAIVPVADHLVKHRRVACGPGAGRARLIVEGHGGALDLGREVIDAVSCHDRKVRPDKRDRASGQA